jgi:hypothetical protein
MNRTHALRFVLLSAAMTGCVSKPKVYRDTWQPASLANASGLPIVSERALQVSPEDEQALRNAGAEFIGHHEAKHDWALRAGSTGGTHFVPIIEDESTTKTHCFIVGTGPFARCMNTRSKPRWTKVAVLRVDPAFWHLLPPHLIPIDKNVSEGTQASAVRTGCTVERDKGTVKCTSKWSVTVNEVLAARAVPPVSHVEAQAQGGENQPSPELPQRVESPTTDTEAPPTPTTSL